MKQPLQTLEPGINHEVGYGFDLEKRHYDDTVTWLAEVLDGSMRTAFEYAFDGQELYGRDGGALKPIFTDSVKDAERLVAEKPNLAFELRRRKKEEAEYEDMLAMAREELPNTMVVVSDFPPELMDATQDVGGYNTRRKQTMLRVITRNEDGTITMRSQSLDRSDREALESMYGYLGAKLRPGELLGQRIHRELPAEHQTYLIDSLTGVYDNSLTSEYGGEWYAGRTPAEMLNTYDFVRSQDDLINTFVAAKLHNSSNAEVMRYGLAAAMDIRFKKRLGTVTLGLIRQSTDYRPVALHEIEHAGVVARAQGKTYNGCGITEDGKSILPTGEQLTEAGLGNKTTPETTYKFDKYMYCRECQPSPTKDDKKTMCGPCGICKPCDIKLRIKPVKAA